MEISIAPYQTQDHAVAVTELTRRITEELEHVLRARPEHWLWTYKRWKYVPAGDDPERYPFYRRAAV
jgi:lauroyl/myristoyl acyltransferase